MKELITAIATSVAAFTSILAIGISIYNEKKKQRKKKLEILTILTNCMRWVNKIDSFQKRLFASENSNLKTDMVMNNCKLYLPGSDPRISVLEEVRRKSKCVGLKDKENQIEEFCELMIDFIRVYMYLKESIEKELKDISENKSRFKEMKKQLKDNCPKEIIDNAGKTGDTEFSECINEYIKELNQHWKKVKQYFKSKWR